MNLDELKDRLTSALHPILTAAEADGLLVGGTINLMGRAWHCVRCNARMLPDDCIRRDAGGMPVHGYGSPQRGSHACGGPVELDDPPYARIARVTIARRGSECIEVTMVEHPAQRLARDVVRAPVIVGGTWEDTPATPLRETIVPPDNAAMLMANEAASGMQYTGDVCPNPVCGSSRVVRLGGCAKCLNCGENVGGCG